MDRDTKGIIKRTAAVLACCALGAVFALPFTSARADGCCSPGIDFPPPVGYDGVPGHRGGDGSGRKVVIVDPTGTDGSARTIAQGLKQVARGGLLMVKPLPESLPYALGPAYAHARVPGYSEALIITKPVRIRSFDPNTKIVLTPPAGASCITVKPGRDKVVELADFVILQSSAASACVLVQSGVFTLSNSVVYGTPGSAAISLADSKSRIEGNLIADSGVGILVNYGYLSSFELKNNTISGNGTGVDVRGPVQVSALGNTIIGNNGVGVIGTGGDGTYQDNLIVSNGGDGILLRNGTNFTSVIANEISNNGGAGIHLESGALARIGANRLDGNRAGPFAGLNEGGFGIFTAPNSVDGKEYKEKRRRNFWGNSRNETPDASKWADNSSAVSVR